MPPQPPILKTLVIGKYLKKVKRVKMFDTGVYLATFYEASVKGFSPQPRVTRRGKKAF